MEEQASIESLEQRLLLSVDAGFVSCTQLGSDSSAIVLQYDMPALELEPVGQATPDGQVFLPNLGYAPVLGDPDMPALPIVSRQIVLPYGYDLAEVSVKTTAPISVDGTYLLMQGQTPVFFEPDDLNPSFPAGPIAYTGGAFTHNLFEVVSIQRSRGVNVLTVNLSPVSYQADTRIVSYVDSMTLSISLAAADVSGNDGNWTVGYRPDDLLPLSSQVDNPSALASYVVGAGVAVEGATGLCDPSDTYDYVVISNQAMVDATADYTIADFAAFKQSQGYSPTVVTVEEIYATYAGVDQQEQIRAFILDAYNNWQTDYVLLAGDTNIIPARQVYVQHPYWEIDDERGYIPTDLYYQCLDGNFNFDGDDKFGEPNDGINGWDVDMLAEVFIGRASAETATEMSNWIAKNIDHQSNTAGEYRWHAAMVGEWMGHTGIGNWGKYKLEELRLGADTHGYSTEGFASDPRFVSEYSDTLYERDLNTGDELAEGEVLKQWSTAQMLAIMNSDVYGIYNHAGHAMAPRVMKLVARDVESLTNDNPFFVYSGACHPGNFTKDAIGENLITASHAAYAVIMNSSFGWSYTYSTTEGPSQHLFREFWDALFGEGLDGLGVMNADSHADSIGFAGMFAYRWVIFATTLLGDPSTAMASSEFSVGTFVDPLKAYVNQPFEFALNARNGQGGYQWTVVDGELPDGLSLNSDTGLITGTAGLTGDWAFTVQVTDQSGAAVEAQYLLSVVTPLEILTSAPDQAQIAVPYSSEIQITGGTGPYTWALIRGALPAGMSLDVDTGVISGTPQAYGEFNFRVTVKDSAAAWQVDSADLTLVVGWPPTEIHGQVFQDVDYNNVRDPGEIGLNGWTVELVDRFTQQVVATALTASVDTNGDGEIDPFNETGLYSFTDIPAGKYEVRQVSQPGWSETGRWTGGRVFLLRDNGVIGATELDVYEIDPTDGTVLNSFPTPEAVSSVLMQGLAAGPESVFYIDGSDSTSQPTLWELDINTGEVIDSDIVDIPLPTATTGLAYLNGRVYIQSWLNEILVWDVYCDRIVDTLTIDATVLGGLTGRADTGVLYGTTLSGVIAIDPATGAIMETLSPGVGAFGGGLAYDYRNGQLIACNFNDTNSTAYRIDPVSGAVVGTFPLPGKGPISGLAGDTPIPMANVNYLDVQWTHVLTGQNFGNVTAVSVEGRVFHDADGNGAGGAGERGLDGWTVELVDLTTGDVVASVETSSIDLNGNGVIDPDTETGLYSLPKLLPGSYELRQIGRPGYTPTTPAGGVHMLTLAAGDAVSGVDFGYAADMATVSGQLYQDSNFSGSRDVGEGGLDGMTVMLVDVVTHDVVATSVTFSEDLDLDGVIDPQVETGLFDFAEVLPGEYELRPALDVWWRQTNPAGGLYTVTLIGGEDLQDLDFAVGQMCYLAGGVFSDVDADGLRDPDETGLNGRIIQLVDASTGLVVATTTTTDRDTDGDGVVNPVTEHGAYYFTALSGSYEIRLVGQDGWLQTDPADSHAATLTYGQQETGLDFASYEYATIAGSIFCDGDVDGEYYWEDGLNGWTVELVNSATGQIVTTEVTAEWDTDGDGEVSPSYEAGLFVFTEVLPGDYELRQVTRPGWLQTAPSGLTFALSIAAGDDIDGLHFGNIEQNVISGQVYDDLNGDGYRQPGEPTIAGWTVELVDSTGQVITTAVTGDVDLNGDGAIDPADETGAYRFADLPAGEYEVRRVGQAGWRQTAPNMGDRVFALRKESLVEIAICEFDPATGVMRNSFAAPAETPLAFFQGLAVGPDRLFYADSAGPNHPAALWELDPNTGAVIASHTIAATGSNVIGLAYFAGKVYLQYQSSEILVWDTTVNAVTDTFTVAYPITGLTGAVDLGVLLAMADGNQVLAIDPADGAVLSATTIAEQLPYAGGVAYWNGELLIAPYIDAARLIYRIDPMTGDILGSYAMPYYNDIVGLGGEGAMSGEARTLQFELQWGIMAVGQNFGVYTSGVMGDFDADGVVDASDIDSLYQHLAPAGEADVGYDLDGDGDVDAADVAVLIHDVLNTEFGDANLDGTVDTVDLTCLATSYGQAGGWTSGDFNGDGVVDTADLTLLGTYFGFLAAVPQPLSTAGLALMPIEGDPAPATGGGAEAEELSVEGVTSPSVNKTSDGEAAGGAGEIVTGAFFETSRDETQQNSPDLYGLAQRPTVAVGRGHLHQPTAEYSVHFEPIQPAGVRLWLTAQPVWQDALSNAKEVLATHPVRAKDRERRASGQEDLEDVLTEIQGRLLPAI